MYCILLSIKLEISKLGITNIFKKDLEDKNGKIINYNYNYLLGRGILGCFKNDMGEYDAILQTGRGICDCRGKGDFRLFLRMGVNSLGVG